jgi:nitrate/TMAO reductase-like tetraheme cytochrome c subunit
VPRLPGFGPRGPLSGARLDERLAPLRRFGPVKTLAAFVVGFALVGLVGFVQMSSTPSFCGSCHIMKPYYQSWKHSSHNKIACVECHISPGITAEVRKKFEALSMVAKYFTATYGTKPWAEVDDAACLRCHERRLLEGRVDFNGVNFDHRPHLTESRRGLRLRCTSCHSQIVQGTHLTVTVSTCALCHFKDQEPNRGLGACRKCHDVPDRVRTPAGNPFDHTQIATMDMTCSSCHGNVVRGDGHVPKRRCQSCHNQADRLAKYSDGLFLHRMHVSEHKVDCQECHDEIEHGIPSQQAMADAHSAARPNTCQSCHGAGHSPQQLLYTGVGARGVPPMPGPMAAVGVTCQGCHNPEFSARTASFGPENPFKVAAGVVACMACHGPAYRPIFEAWTEGIARRTGALREQLNATAAALGRGAPRVWDDARWNFQLVSEGRGIHNINYAYVVLDKAFEQMNEARRAKGLGALSRPWPVIAGGACLSCHLGIERQSGSFNGSAFAHGPHLEQAKLACETCHRKHAERPKFEVVRFGSEGCSGCHHKGLTPSNFKQCSNCHGDVTKRTYTTFRGEFSHQQHLEIGEDCVSCHAIQAGDPRPARSHCTECHN